MAGVFAFASAFLACAVELVEAATIVLAVGFTRGWRPALAAAAAATGIAAAAIAVFGPALERVPLDDLRLLVGVLLLVFGLQWLRKAVLRASGRKAKRDENAKFEQEVAEAQADRTRSAFALTFQGVLLEELEVAVIVLTLGAAHGSVTLAAVAAAAAFVVVTAAAAIARHPLSRVPENALALAVGVMLTSFGLFWTVEGVRVHWPGGEALLPVLVAAVAACAAVERLQDAARADEARRVRAAQRRDLHDVARVRRVDEGPAAGVDTHVSQPVEEDEVAGLELVERDRDTGPVLRVARVRQRHATCAYAYITRPEQSKPPGEAPPQTYGVPRYCIAIPTTPPKCEEGAAAAGCLRSRRRGRDSEGGHRRLQGLLLLLLPDLPRKLGLPRAFDRAQVLDLRANRAKELVALRELRLDRRSSLRAAAQRRASARTARDGASPPHAQRASGNP